MNILYHHSHSHNRQSILSNGLQTKYDQTVDLEEPGVIGGIFLSKKPDYSSKSDIWEVNISGLVVEEDWSGQPEDLEDTWYVIYQNISPSRILLLRG